MPAKAENQHSTGGSGQSSLNPATMQADWHSLDSPPFRIYYLDSDRPYTRELSSLFHIAYLDFVTRLQLNLTQPVNVFLCPTQKVFDDLTGNFIPHWGEGVADPVKNLIILKSPALTDNRDRLPKLVRHELSHILIGQTAKSPQNLPKWFNEGIAIYLSADEEFAAGKAISKALISNSIIPLDEIDDVLRFQHAKATLAYEESYSFVLYLIEQYGFGKIAQLLSELDTGQSFDVTFKDVFAIDLFEAEMNWYQYLEKKYRWTFLLDFDLFLWIFILLLFIFILIAIRWRNKRTLEKWDEEERLANW